MTALDNQDRLVSISATDAAAALQRQIAQIGKPGDLDLFGEVRTAADCAKALREVARVANLFADKLA